jgi:hypothetical protein
MVEVSEPPTNRDRSAPVTERQIIMKTSFAAENEGLLTRTEPHRIRPLRKHELRREYRRGESERAENSISLALSYPNLKALTVDLLFFQCEIVSWGHGLRYRANLDTARSVLRFNCPSVLCKGGDFDLSNELRKAIVERRAVVAGEMRCQGSRDQETGETIRCESALHYKMSLVFKKIRAAFAGKITPGTKTRFTRRCKKSVM